MLIHTQQVLAPQACSLRWPLILASMGVYHHIPMSPTRPRNPRVAWCPTSTLSSISRAARWYADGNGARKVFDPSPHPPTPRRKQRAMHRTVDMVPRELHLRESKLRFVIIIINHPRINQSINQSVSLFHFRKRGPFCHVPPRHCFTLHFVVLPHLYQQVKLLENRCWNGMSTIRMRFPISFHRILPHTTDLWVWIMCSNTS